MADIKRTDLKLCIMKCVTNKGIRLMNGRVVNPNVKVELNRFERFELVRKSGYVLYEVMPDGSLLKLNLKNYNTVNVPVTNSTKTNATVHTTESVTEPVSTVTTQDVTSVETGVEEKEEPVVDEPKETTPVQTQYQGKKNKKNKGQNGNRPQATVTTTETEEEPKKETVEE